MTNDPTSQVILSIKRADLHCHSTCSDGTLTPVQLVEKAHEIGLSGLSITDHDSIEAYRSAVPRAEELGLPIIPGVELSTMHHDTSIHVLAYAFSLTNTDIKEFCRRHQVRREERNKAILHLLKTYHMPLDYTEIMGVELEGTVGRPHIAQALVKKGYVKTVREAFQKYLGDGKRCFVTGKHFSVQETLEVIKASGGKAIIAHPMLIRKRNVVKDLLKMEFDGLEGYYANIDNAQEQRWIQVANERNWLVTGGSDCHGALTPALRLGCSWAPSETFDALCNHYEERKNAKC